MTPGPLSSIPRVLISKLSNSTQQNKALKWQVQLSQVCFPTICYHSSTRLGVVVAVMAVVIVCVPKHAYQGIPSSKIDL